MKHRPCLRLAPALVVAVLAGAGLQPALAQYKVVQPDGSTTYTDRPPTSGNARVTPLGHAAGTAAAATQGDASFPLELRQAAQRYPVTLLTTTDCPPCDTGRQWLQQRGVPYTEKRVLTQDDEQALLRLVGGRSLPSLTVGAQPVRGFSETEWQAYLDAAGYPREARLPRGWQPPPVTPLVATAPVRTTPVVPPALRAEPVTPTPPAAPVGTIRF
jgi:glutaredoxin